jgi:hypothetical protein
MHLDSKCKRFHNNLTLYETLEFDLYNFFYRKLLVEGIWLSLINPNMLELEPRTHVYKYIMCAAPHPLSVLKYTDFLSIQNFTYFQEFSVTKFLLYMEKN